MSSAASAQTPGKSGQPPQGALFLFDRSTDSFDALQKVGAQARDLLQPVEDWNKGDHQFLLLLITEAGSMATTSSDFEDVRMAISEIAVDMHSKLGDISGIRFESHLEDVSRGEYFDGFWSACLAGVLKA